MFRKQNFAVVLIIIFHFFNSSLQDQKYFYSEPQRQHRQNYQVTENPYLNTQQDSFRNQRNNFGQLEAFLQNPDLDTSDLPSHLQRTLPQYHIGLHENPTSSIDYQNTPEIYHHNILNRHLPHYTSQQQQIIPSTHRPSYSHLFSKGAHSHDPLRTETFLGQITIQSPADFPVEFHNKKLTNFQPAVPIQRPADVHKLTRPNENIRSTVSPLTRFISHISNEDNQIKKPKLSNNSVLLGVPSRSSFLNHRTRIVAPTSEEDSENKPEVNDYFVNNDGEVFLANFKDNSTNQLADEKNKLDASSVKPNKSEDLKNEDKTEHGLDSATEETGTIRNTHTKILDSSIDEEYEEYDDITDEPSEEEEDSLIKNDLISIVTTKSVINNTIIGTDTPVTTVNVEMTTHTTEESDSENFVTKRPNLKDQILAPNKNTNENSTDGWVVVASVQTSRSVSGARYLPHEIVEQREENKLLSDAVDTSESDAVQQTTTTEYEEYSTLESVNKQKSSTESLIDKLDRVQSDLSSGLIATGFNSGINNIAVITEGMLEKMEETTTYDELTSSTTELPKVAAPLPAVTIRKYSPNLRPSTTSRSKSFIKLTNQRRKMNVPVNSDIMQNDEQSKNALSKNGTTGRSSGISNKNQIVVQDINQNKRTEDLEKLLKKIVFQDSTAFLPSDYKTKIESANYNKSVTLDSNSTKDIDNQNYIPSSKLNFKPKDDLASLLLSNYKKSLNTDQKNSTVITPTDVFKVVKQDDISKFLPPGYKIPSNEEQTTKKDLNTDKLNISLKVEPVDISKFLPPGYNLSKISTQPVDISSLLPPGYKPPVNHSSVDKRKLPNVKPNLSHSFSKEDDISAFLPPGYKTNVTSNKPTNSQRNFTKSFTKEEDITSFLPPGYKLNVSSNKPTSQRNFSSLFSKEEDISAFLPPGYKANNSNKPTTTKQNTTNLFSKEEDVSAFLPPGYKLNYSSKKPVSTTTTITPVITIETPISSTPSPSVKVVFPSRPGGLKKTNRITTPRTANEKAPPINANTSPAISIRKGLPIRATTEFTGWPTPSTTPISIEKLLEAARAAAITPKPTTSTSTDITFTSSTTTTTTSRPTTPGMCKTDCDLAGTIKLVGGAKWVPELLDRNTKEWQILANEVQFQLEDIYSKSTLLNKWYKKIRIDGFSEGSVFVDYLVELNNISKALNTKELKSLFNEALDGAFKNSLNREAKASDLNDELVNENKIMLGNFVVDPTYTDFIVIPKQIVPTVGYAENDVLLPQWAIAIIVIGLASLLFVIIFGATVLVNKQKNAKKKQPSTLTEDMLNELDKNHMGGIDNYAADDMYNMEDVWGDNTYDVKPSKKRSLSSLNEQNMPNIYDSWKSEWNGYYYNTHYGNQPSSSNGGYGRRRSDYDTNF